MPTYTRSPGLLVVIAMLLCGAGVRADDLDVPIFQFALNLEYLEASFYSCAAYGVPLSANVTGGGPTPTGCQKANLSPAIQALAEDLAADEYAHVQDIRAALLAVNITPVAIPVLDIDSAFAAAADASTGSTLSPPFSPYTTDENFLLGAYIFEDVGASAYLGAVPLLTNLAYLPVVGGIEAVEAYHAAAIRASLFKSATTFEFPYGVTFGAITELISKLRDSAAGTNIDSGILGSRSSFSIAPTTLQSLLSPRSPAEVLKIVYLGGNSTGGFFPNGLNGAISSAV